MPGLIHETAIEKILQQDPNIKTKGFSKSIKEIVSEDILEDNIFLESVRIVPDGYKIEDGGHYEFCKTITIIEAEDSSKVNNNKMEKIINLWMLLDSESHILNLHIYDRYGNFISDVDINEYYYKNIKDER